MAHAQAIRSLDVTLATFAPQPGGVWRHMVDLGLALTEQSCRVRIAISDDAEDLRARAHAFGFTITSLEDTTGDVWHIHLDDTLDKRAIAALLRRVGGRQATVATEHLPRNPASDPRLLPGNRKPGAHVFKTVLKRSALLATDRTIFVSDASRRFVIERYGVTSKRLCVVLNAPQGMQKRKARDVGADGIAVVAVGSLIMQKGMDVLIDAAAGAKGWQVRVLGDGPHRRSLEGRAEKMGGTVHLAGWQEQALDEVAASDIFCLPSRWEACPYVILEAMALGLPVVATAVDGVPELVEDGMTGRLVPPDDPAALRRALDELVEDAALRDRLGDAAAERVERDFRFADMVRATRSVYAEALEARGARRLWRR